MEGILDLLKSTQGEKIIHGLSQETGTTPDKTAEVLSMAMPLLLGAMKKNASNPEGAKNLMSAIENKHNGGILDNLGSLFQGGVDANVLQDGSGILGHLLGGKQAKVEHALGQKTGVDANTISRILKIAAPIIMGYLGKKKSQHGVSDAGSMNSLLGGMLGGQPQQNQSLIMSLIDSDGDGSVLDDVAGMVLGGKKKGGLGGMLGGMFGK